jgi:hypothetical protein
MIKLSGNGKCNGDGYEFCKVDRWEGGNSGHLWDSFPYANSLNLIARHLWTKEHNNRWENLLTFSEIIPNYLK